jgi:hypothetical protein
MDEMAGIFDSSAATAVFCYASILAIEVFGVWWSWMLSRPARRRQRWARLTAPAHVR